MPEMILTSHSARELIHENALDGFSAIWTLDLPWFEPPNYRREGWSGVCRTTLRSGSAEVPVFIKRQQNHNFRSPLHPLTVRPTLYREFSYARRFNRKGLSTYDVILYAERKIDNELCAIMVTHALDAHVTLDEWLDSDQGRDPVKRAEMLKGVARTIRRLHDSGLRHGCLYGKHIMVRCDDDDLDVRFIDLEKAGSSLLRSRIALQDLDQFLRHHASSWRATDSELFINNYCGAQDARGLIGRLRRRLQRKRPAKSYLLDF